MHVVTLDPVTVYGINRAIATTDAFLAIPVDALGTEYINLGYGNGFVGIFVGIAKIELEKRKQ